uniref:Uncharacterized protein n=1 Tax=Panagrolaimus sp. PS1159 TaxID=55785 RepID=A0AC35F5T6_9BILA
MLYWEYRRILRQKWRHFRPIPEGATYQQISRGRILVTFALFFVAWKSMGLYLNEKLLYNKDETTGEYRYFQPREMKAIIKEKRMAMDTGLKKKETLTVEDVTKFPLDD